MNRKPGDGQDALFGDAPKVRPPPDLDKAALARVLRAFPMAELLPFEEVTPPHSATTESSHHRR